MTGRRLRPEDLHFTPPCVPRVFLEKAVSEHFGLAGRSTRLAGERDQNLRLDTDDGQSFVVKLSGAHEDPAVVDLQVRALAYIEAADREIAVPRVVPSTDGAEVVFIETANGDRLCLRVLTYLEGEPWALRGRPTRGDFREIGRFQGRLCRALSGFRHPAAGHFVPWDAGNGLILDPGLLEDASPEVLRALTPDLLADFERRVLPALHSCRRQVIHNDVHMGNLLRARDGTQAVTGLIDFGDMVEGALVQDLAPSLSSFLVRSDDRVADAAALVGGFHSAYPLEPAEIDVLYDIVLLQSVLTIALLDFHVRHGTTSGPAFGAALVALLPAYHEFIAIDAAVFTDASREACGHSC